MNIYDDLEFKATLLATEFAELYKKFSGCFYTALTLESAAAIEDIHSRVSDLELGMCHIRAQLTTLHRRMLIFSRTACEWERKQRLLHDLRREARMGNYGKESGKQRLIREVEAQVHHLAVEANKRASCTYEDYNVTLVRAACMPSDCAKLLGCLDGVTESVHACAAAAVRNFDQNRYEQCLTVLNVLKPAKETLAYLEQKLIELQTDIRAAHDRPVKNMRSRAQLMLLQVVE